MSEYRNRAADRDRENRKGGFSLKKYVPLLILILLGAWTWGSYNGMVSGEEAVESQWANVGVAYQARMDKTKNLIEIVKKAADFEKEALSDIVEARSKATSIQLSVDDLTPENLAKFQQAQGQLGASLGRLMAIAENYPTLQSVQAFRDFQAQYEGMENRIGVERRKFNETAKEFNKKIKKFPGNLFNAMFGFEEKGYFEAQEGAEQAPEINFD